MNLYAVSPDPTECSKWLDTKRLGWAAIKESSQLISTALAVKFGIETVVKPSHLHHPVSLWVRSNAIHLCWTLEYMLQCSIEYKRRIGKHYHINKIPDTELYLIFHETISEYFKIPDALPLNSIEFCNCACRKDLGIDYRHIENVHDAYRMYLAHRWMTDKRMPTWK